MCKKKKKEGEEWEQKKKLEVLDRVAESYILFGKFLFFMFLDHTIHAEVSHVTLVFPLKVCALAY